MRKLHLPVSMARATPGETPSVDATRARLGGTAHDGSDAGEVVAWGDAPTDRRVGVVLHTQEEEVDVLFLSTTSPKSSMMVRRTRRNELRTVLDEPLSRELADARAAVRAYAAMHNGQPVRYEDAEGTRHEATIVEKCRYGALVERPDGIVLGIGFRRLLSSGAEP